MKGVNTMGRGGLSFSLGCTSGMEIRGEDRPVLGRDPIVPCVDRGAEILDVAEIGTIYRQCLLRESWDKGGWALVTCVWATIRNVGDALRLKSSAFNAAGLPGPS